MKAFLLSAILASTLSGIVTAMPTTPLKRGTSDWYFTLFDNSKCELTGHHYWEGTGTQSCTPIPYSGVYFSKQTLADNCVVNFYTDVECQQYYTDLTSEYPEIGTCGHFEQMPYSFLVYCS